MPSGNIVSKNSHCYFDLEKIWAFVFFSKLLKVNTYFYVFWRNLCGPLKCRGPKAAASHHLQVYISLEKTLISLKWVNLIICIYILLIVKVLFQNIMLRKFGFKKADAKDGESRLKLQKELFQYNEVFHN